MKKCFVVFASLCALAGWFGAGPKSAAQVDTKEDITSLIPINRVQGDSDVSPLAGQPLTVRGVVTAVLGRGFYIQTPDAETDKNPKTSEGLYIFTGDKPAADLAFRSPNQRD